MSHVHCMNCECTGDYPSDTQDQNGILAALPEWQVSGADWFCPDCLNEQMVGSALAYGTKLIPDLDMYFAAVEELVEAKKIDARVLEGIVHFKTQTQIMVDHLKKQQ